MLKQSGLERVFDTPAGKASLGETPSVASRERTDRGKLVPIV
ncbi:hypothetical protein [Bacillus sp. SD075]|nr:hypothetical protein [Bacillus sp. SD075]